MWGRKNGLKNKELIMDIESALNFMGCSIFVALGLIAIGGAVLIVNNLFMKYWKPVPIWTIPDYKFVDAPISKHDEPKL